MFWKFFEIEFLISLNLVNRVSILPKSELS